MSHTLLVSTLSSGEERPLQNLVKGILIQNSPKATHGDKSVHYGARGEVAREGVD